MLRLTIAASVIAVGLAAPAAQARSTICSSAYPIRVAVIKKHGKRAPGRNICRWGVKTRHGTRKATTHERAAYKRQLRALHHPRYALLSSAGAPRQAPAGTQTPRAGGVLNAIAACESGGDPTAVSPTGAYTGLYQFDDATWRSVGGTGRAGNASAAEQDQRAAILYSQRGSAPWPICGR